MIQQVRMFLLNVDLLLLAWYIPENLIYLYLSEAINFVHVSNVIKYLYLNIHTYKNMPAQNFKLFDNNNYNRINKDDTGTRRLF